MEARSRKIYRYPLWLALLLPIISNNICPKAILSGAVCRKRKKTSSVPTPEISSTMVLFYFTFLIIILNEALLLFAHFKLTNFKFM